jgi:hypothetical protein
MVFAARSRSWLVGLRAMRSPAGWPALALREAAKSRKGGYHRGRRQPGFADVIV